MTLTTVYALCCFWIVIMLVGLAVVRGGAND